MYPVLIAVLGCLDLVLPELRQLVPDVALDLPDLVPLAPLLVPDLLLYHPLEHVVLLRLLLQAQCLLLSDRQLRHP